MKVTIKNGIAIMAITCITDLNNSGDMKLKIEPKILPKPVVVINIISTIIFKIKGKVKPLSQGALQA